MRSEELNSFCNNYYNWWKSQQRYDDSEAKQNESDNDFDNLKSIVFLNKGG